MLRVEKKESISNITGLRELSHLAGVFSILVDMYSTFSLHRSSWLTDREKEFFVAFAIVHNMELDHESEEASQIYEKIFKQSSNKFFHNYLVKLKKKGWIKKEEVYHIPELFTDVDPREHTFNINISLIYRHEND